MRATTATSIPIELLRKYDRPGPRYTSYPTAPVWSGGVGNDDYRVALRAAAVHTDKPLALYCHIPFCRSRCFYCGCNTCITRSEESVSSYLDMLEREIGAVAGLLDRRKQVSQLHFGGGTPTYIGNDGLERIMTMLDRHFSFTDRAEMSIELDPRVTTCEQLRYLSERGFNRVSLGVQDLDPQVQEAIGRVQSEQMVADMLAEARALTFRGINFDLIYGLPFQTVDSFGATLEKVIAMRPDRLAVYSFAYLPNVKSNQAKIRPEDLPTTEEKYRLFATAVEMFTAAGYKQIGMDHFALPDDELSLAQDDGRLHRNFMGYTVQAAPEMIGFGMSSIGYVNDAFFQNQSGLDSYKSAIAEDGLAVYRGMHLSQDDLVRQYVISSLMCNFYLPFNDLRARFQIDYRTDFTAEHERLAEFFDDDFLTESEDGLTITPVGRTFVRNIAMTFDAYLSGDGNGRKPTFSRTI
ncbi:oxygen-independent coproporphyrinogen III oxidase [bacterium]|nr:oxygen-independent coproporphyrinogen III oxidase [bacterium]